MLTRFRSVFGMLGAFFRGTKLEDRLRDELQLHVDLLTEKNIRLGIAPDEAQRQARMAVGGFEQARETVRDARGFGFIEDIGRDFHYGLRALHRSPGFAAVAALTLAIGIGANTAIFTAVYAVLWQPLPYPDPERLVLLETTFTVPGKPVQVFPEWSYPRFEALRSQDLAFSELAAFSDQVSVLTSIFFALVPSFRASKTDLNVSLKEAPGQWAQSRRGRPTVTGRRVLVVAELSLALTLLTGAGLLIKSFVRLLTTDLGIPTKNLLTPTKARRRPWRSGPRSRAHILAAVRHSLELRVSHAGVRRQAPSSSIPSPAPASDPDRDRGTGRA